ncbi:MAG: tRNA (adenosine(37)-N6)-threonylcarbamoyltransferase complex ATPase subunit type 1 TsaE [Chloroflexi bacterium]|nr:tRNA (adenosine(37)-N6)-threonylcarbamoyltransferase complex ATPase subunit type 1 TsaE [Chloroflexota bacterium]
MRTMNTQSAFQITTTSVQQTIAFGTLLGQHLQRGDMVLLAGDLGAGKTHLTKGIVAGTGSNDQVTSPTFVFINEYRTPVHVTLYHVDLYRITMSAELDSIGLADATAGHGIALIEWPERDPSLFDMPHLAVHIHHLSPTTRTITCTAHGVRAHTLIGLLTVAWSPTKDNTHARRN